MSVNRGNLKEATHVVRSETFPFIAVLQGLLLALVISAILLLTCAAVIHWTNTPEHYSPVMVFFAGIIGVLYGSRSAGKKIGSRGWLNGGGVGLLYVASVLLLGFIFIENFAVGLNVFSKAFLGFVFGAFGGMWGVNT